MMKSIAHSMETSNIEYLNRIERHRSHASERRKAVRTELNRSLLDFYREEAET